MPNEPETATLLEWINSIPLGTSIQSSNDLYDGVILWEILQDIDPHEFLGVLPESSPEDHWVLRWQNLKHLHKLLLNYIRNRYDGEIPAGLSTDPDLKSIAETASTKETNRLLKLFLMAAIRSPGAESYIERMVQLSTATQEGLKGIIEEAQNPTQDRLDQINYEQDEYKARRDVAMDPELQFEERVGKLLVENDKLSNEKKQLEKDIQDFHRKDVRLREANEVLQDKLNITEDRLARLKSGKADIGPNFKGYEHRTQDIIAAQETKLTAAQDEIDGLRISLETLRVKNQKYQTLQDEYDEIKIERDQLARKANAAEKYRQKLQASQDYEKENQVLKNKVKDLQQHLKESDTLQRVSAARETEVENYRRLVARVEQDRHEIQDLKKKLEFDNHALSERLLGAEEQRTRDEDTIGRLQERIRELEGLNSPASPRPSTPKDQDSSLERDLEESGKREAQLNAENEELKKKLETIVAVDNAAPTTDDAESEVPAEKKWKEDFYKCPLQTDSEIKDAHQRLHLEHTIMRTKIVELEGLLEATKLQLSDSNMKLSLLNKDKLEMVNEVAESNAVEQTALREKCAVLAVTVRTLTSQLEVRQLQLNEISRERDNLRTTFKQSDTKLSTEGDASLEEMKQLLEEANVRVNDTTDDDMTNEFLERLAETTERSAEHLARRAEHMNQQNDVIESLQERIRHYEQFSTDQEEVKANKEKETELMQIIHRQAREIALISSAWYDFQSRLQNGNIVLSRHRGAAGASAHHAEANRTWLGKQRALVVPKAGGR
ncbi:hypothetical protein FQN49_002379 [Arthroderma sp. PD_2]|nr:hypothetical protein FQN49_002379 [Arthroderma sp. PD_2]